MKTLDALASLSTVAIHQKKEWGEIVTGFETRNRYEIADGSSGRTILMAAEEARSLLARWFLKAHRPFTMHLLTVDGDEFLTVERPFRFYFHEAEILDAEGTVLGRIKRQFTLLRRKYVIEDGEGREVCELFGPILHPWTFQILVDGREIGKITKKWSGLLKEGFTDADTFGMELPAELDSNTKAVFLGAVFLIDFVHFEGRQ